MRVIADTSPLHYLVLIEHAAILPARFGTILIPPIRCRSLGGGWRRGRAVRVLMTLDAVTRSQ